jgi:hypothetical protein
VRVALTAAGNVIDMPTHQQLFGSFFERVLDVFAGRLRLIAFRISSETNPDSSKAAIQAMRVETNSSSRRAISSTGSLGLAD